MLSRRNFISRTTLATAASALTGPAALSAFAAEQQPATGIFVFSKVYQEINLNFEDAAALTAEAGLDGVDCPVRPKGEILPEKAAEDLPRYVEILRARKLGMPLITTAIISTDTPHTETVLRTARRLGIRYYRFGSQQHSKDVPLQQQLAEVKAQLKDLAALNKEIGICGIYQNHSPGGRKYIGGDLTEMQQLVLDFDPNQIGVAFDIGHALVVHGDQWAKELQQFSTHLRIAYVKDVIPDQKKWVALGKGGIGKTTYFQQLKKMNYHAPVSLHVEYDWHNQGRDRTRPQLLKTLKHDTAVLRQWLA